jgi:uncharacterized protein YjbJ (UPF0337 family)
MGALEEGLKGKAKEVAGKLIGDDELRSEGERHEHDAEKRQETDDARKVGAGREREDQPETRDTRSSIEGQTGLDE